MLVGQMTVLAVRALDDGKAGLGSGQLAVSQKLKIGPNSNRTSFHSRAGLPRK